VTDASDRFGLGLAQGRLRYSSLSRLRHFLRFAQFRSVVSAIQRRWRKNVTMKREISESMIVPRMLDEAYLNEQT